MLEGKVISRNPANVSVDADGHVVMMSVEKGMYFSIDGVGKAVWDEITEPATFEDVIDRLLASYDVERETCVVEVTVFLENLREQGLILISDAP